MDPVKIALAPKHVNNGACPKCDMIIRRYPGFYQPLWDWFLEFQDKHHEAHTSCAGRGHLDQEDAFLKKVSRAEWGASAHNWNCALDLFAQLSGDTNIYNRVWFEKTLKPNLAGFMKWYGSPGSPYPELPHVEVTNWKTLVKVGALKLVEEPMAAYALATVTSLRPK